MNTDQGLPKREKCIWNELKLMSLFLKVMETVCNQVRNLSSLFDSVCAIFVAGVGLCKNY